MPTPKKGPRLASSPAHERLMLANMATSLFQNGRITTTLPKAKRLRPLAERLITFAKRGDLHSRRRVMRVIRNKSVVHLLFTQIAEQMEQREGGYTRIVKIASRTGDNAPAAIIELVTEPVSPKKAVVKEAEAATKTAAKAEAAKDEVEVKDEAPVEATAEETKADGAEKVEAEAKKDTKKSAAKGGKSEDKADEAEETKAE
ncbi:50S ribosomal protein L17 [Bifidobacterium panos]|uniref:Large ribosomal subunit protein bL17 n=1 Tax=Bifidobacterium panos TaxID=2675321 RepID=A0ABX1SWS7_9BIFI|nr:50S ribosomal protein L17 [Bifidobacterium sp. DSM 109963]NMN02286.1 50S ribosomal protein L17 [Bifidobacterium sp. DSM 109963]